MFLVDKIGSIIKLLHLDLVLFISHDAYQDKLVESNQWMEFASEYLGDMRMFVMPKLKIEVVATGKFFND